MSAVMYCKQNIIGCSPDKILQFLCKRKVSGEERVESERQGRGRETGHSQRDRAEGENERRITLYSPLEQLTLDP